ncbi:hypothetical protein [Siphonobacter sp. SORGH_AS_1065]|uniref:hypothetical protein n=1 Tax=Siphonobacter sp. SORGH_AS_1065 TaxID=3041795 RepID=UPI0027890E6E|nr:hypothetical protein [Siphonobacter sp. SORGH_AS_1065]MDQ1090005.1 hypothetical protein [Siphonobacter sp. SORGH_AS_1065]
MNDYLKISGQGIRFGQMIGSMMVSLFLVIYIIYLCFNFSYIELLILLIILYICYWLFSKNMYKEIYYENGKIYLRDLFKQEVYDITMFKEIRAQIVGCSITFKDGKAYYFYLPHAREIKSIFKNDPAFYAKELHNQLLEKRTLYLSVNY